jgi:hypothetical protein
MALDLSEVSTENTRGDIVLCNADVAGELCDVEILNHSASANSLRSSLLPIDCLLPRFTEDGGAICFRRTEHGVLYRTIDPEGRFTDQPFPHSWLPDDVVQLGATVLIRKAYKLFFWTGRTLEAEEELKVLWLQRGVRAAYAVACERFDEFVPRECRIEEITNDRQVTTVWHSSTLTPTALHPLGERLLLVDASSADSRELMLVTITGTTPLRETVWSSTVPVD